MQNKNLEAVRSDVMSIPLRDGVADACISIAVIHHLSTKVSTYIHILGVVTSKTMHNVLDLGKISHQHLLYVDYQ